MTTKKAGPKKPGAKKAAGKVVMRDVDLGRGYGFMVESPLAANPELTFKAGKYSYLRQDNPLPGLMDRIEALEQQVRALTGAQATRGYGAGFRMGDPAPEPLGTTLMVGMTTPVAVSTPEAAPVSLPPPRTTMLPVNMSADLRAKVERSERLVDHVSRLSQNVTFQVSAQTASGLVLKEMRGRTREFAVEQFKSRPEVVAQAEEILMRHGIQVLRRGRFGLTCRGPAALLSDMLKTPFQIVANPRVTNIRSMGASMESPAAPEPEELSIVPAHSLAMRPALGEAIDHFNFYPAPCYFQTGPSAQAPSFPWFGLNGGDVRRLLNVPADLTGEGVRVALIDTGFYSHPHYAAHQYRTVDVPGNEPSSLDLNGHGTAMAWNVFQTAPGAELLGIRHSAVPSDALEIAAEQGATIISCSWGWDREERFVALELTIRELIAEGHTLLFASGNGHYAWPGSMPEVISVGGVYADPQNALWASNYASGFMSSLYRGRQVPDVCGLVGELPRAVYLMLPCPPGCEMDQDLGHAAWPDGDGIGPADGWVGCSGTSAATPQVAGVVALLIQAARQKGRELSPPEVADLLRQTATGVTQGFNAQSFPATPQQPNGAVGHGLVNAEAALALV